MNSKKINSSKTYFIVGIMLFLLVISSSLSIMHGQAQAAPGKVISDESANIRSGYCSVSRSLVHRAILQRLDFAWSDGRGNALGLRDSVTLNDNEVRGINLQRLDFAWSDGRGNALGLRDGDTSLANHVLAAICP